MPDSQPPPSGVVIVGAGQAASELAIRLRQAGYTAPVTLVGSEPHLPYQRPPLSKAFLSGHVTSADLLLRQDTAYAKADITFIGGTLGTGLDLARHIPCRMPSSRRVWRPGRSAGG